MFQSENKQQSTRMLHLMSVYLGKVVCQYNKLAKTGGNSDTAPAIHHGGDISEAGLTFHYKGHPHSSKQSTVPTLEGSSRQEKNAMTVFAHKLDFTYTRLSIPSSHYYNRAC